MLSRFFDRKPYQPSELSNLAEAAQVVSEVPRLVAKQAKSTRDAKGHLAPIEHNWLYTGTANHALDRAHFARFIGVDASLEGLMDGVIASAFHTTVAVACSTRSGDVGIQITGYPALSYSGAAASRSAFVANSALILDRTLPDLLSDESRDQLAQRVGNVSRATEADLLKFLLSHPDRQTIRYPCHDQVALGEVVFLPNSIWANMFATPGSYSPTRDFLLLLGNNRYDGGELMGDGHIHRALTAKRNAGDPWLEMLAQRFGPTRGASVLSLYDSDVLMQMESLGKELSINRTQYALHEIFVIDDGGELVAHSALNMGKIMAGEAVVNRFIDVTKRSLSAPSNPDYRLKYHEMMTELTTQKDVSEPISRCDYQ